MQKRLFHQDKLSTNKGTKAPATGCSRQKKKHPNNMTTMDCGMETFQQQALEVREPDENFDPSTEPQTGEEFLTRMAYERKQCPTVVVRPLEKFKNASTNKNKPKYLKDNEELETSDCSPANLRPTAEWKYDKTAEFLETRERINQMRTHLEAHNYSNELEPPLISNPVQWMNFCKKHPPLLSIILRIPQRSLEQLLDMLCEWLREWNQQHTAVPEEPKEPIGENADGKDATTKEPTVENACGKDDAVEEPTRENADGKDDAMEEPTRENADGKDDAMEEPTRKNSDGKDDAIDEPAASTSAAATSSTAMRLKANQSCGLVSEDEWLGSWLYATLVCLSLPLEPDIHSTLRDIARSCIRLRNRLSPEDTEKVVPFNLFITLIANVFDQLDFAEFI